MLCDTVNFIHSLQFGNRHLVGTIYAQNFNANCSCQPLIIKNYTFMHLTTCCDMGQNDTISKIELNPSFVLSSDNTNCKNDIQLFHQLFDELRVNGDCH